MKMSDFRMAMGTILEKDFAQAQVHNVNGISAEVQKFESKHPKWKRWKLLDYHQVLQENPCKTRDKPVQRL